MPVKALLVDDEENILLTLGLLLKREGFDVETASSSQGAKTLLVNSKFDVIITDITMETETAGYEVVHAAKQQQPNKPATIVISGYPDLLRQWEVEGADAGLQKPTEFTELLHLIKSLIVTRDIRAGDHTTRRC